MTIENEAAIKIRGVWCSILGVEIVATDHNFFEIGGDSMLAMFAAETISRELDVPLSVHDIYEYPTLDTLCAHVIRIATEPGESSLHDE